MSKKILIDAAFPEETRVALLENDVVQNLDREISSIKQLKGNIYLAKVIRVEPSLQAAFINYGGDRHGFLPFSDIHPDYYNIPEDKKTDLTAVNFFNLEDEDKNLKMYEDEEITEAKTEDFEVENFVKIDDEGQVLENIDDIQKEFEAENSTEGQLVNELDLKDNDMIDDNETEQIDTYYRNYKIEDTIKEGQYLLVQVLKEERGEKGVALTTYISLAGKYCVLMGNVLGKGGISKKITNLRDRKILKNILYTLNPNNKKSVIIRTAGIGKKPEEILRDYIYLTRLWDIIKQTVLESTAPTFIHSEDDLIKRTIREVCDDKVNEIIVEGQEDYKTIKSLLNLIIPEQKIQVKLHNEKIPLFHKMEIEEQVSELYNNKILLPSGASIVIDQTEALVTIDVNSGKSTKEKNIEETALATNIEAAKEIARQLKLRDIGGLIVIDFIDMFETKNRHAVEKAMRDATAYDKAKIQIDRISMLGLLEMSRQRINASYNERVSETCPFCQGRGKVKAKNIAVLNILRAIKYAAKDKNSKVIYVYSSEENIIYLMNYKRNEIKEIEQIYNIKIFFNISDEIIDNNFEIKKRQSLTSEEELNLNPSQPQGKVNQMFNDAESYSLNENEIEKYEFKEECYFQNTQNIKQNNSVNREKNNININKKNQNNRKNNNKQLYRKNTESKGIFKRFFEMILKFFK